MTVLLSCRTRPGASMRRVVRREFGREASLLPSPRRRPQRLVWRIRSLFTRVSRSMQDPLAICEGFQLHAGSARYLPLRSMTNQPAPPVSRPCGSR